MVSKFKNRGSFTAKKHFQAPKFVKRSPFFYLVTSPLASRHFPDSSEFSRRGAAARAAATVLPPEHTIHYCSNNVYEKSQRGNRNKDIAKGSTYQPLFGHCLDQITWSPCRTHCCIRSMKWKSKNAHPGCVSFLVMSLTLHWRVDTKKICPFTFAESKNSNRKIAPSLVRWSGLLCIHGKPLTLKFVLEHLGLDSIYLCKKMGESVGFIN